MRRRLGAALIALGVVCILAAFCLDAAPPEKDIRSSVQGAYITRASGYHIEDISPVPAKTDIIAKDACFSQAPFTSSD